jgi:putative ABC transport system permease protein
MNRFVKICSKLFRVFADEEITASAEEYLKDFYSRTKQDKGTITAVLLCFFRTLTILLSFFIEKLTWGNSMVINYLKITFRNIKRHEVFSAINIAGLTIGLTLCLLVVQETASLFSSDRFHKNKDSIYRVISSETAPDGEILEFATAPMPLEFEVEMMWEVEEAVKIKKGFADRIMYKDLDLQISGYYADKEFFRLFSFDLEKGDPDTALSEPNSIVLTQELADKLFPDMDPMGQSIETKKLGAYTITGVIKKNPRQISHFQFECLAAASTLASLESQQKIPPTLNNWNNRNDNYLYILTRKKADPIKIETALTAISEKHLPDKDSLSFHLQPLIKISPGRRLINEISTHPSDEGIYYPLVIAGIILLIACFNYTNLSMAKSLSRAKEIGIRKVIGAHRRHLFNQLVGEAVFLSLLAMAAAVFIIRFFKTELFYLIAEPAPSLSHWPSPYLFLGFILITLLTGFISGFLPALVLSKFNPILILKDITQIRVFKRLTLRKILLALQFGISFIFITYTMTQFKQIRYMKNFEYGLDTRNIVNVTLQDVPFEIFRQEVADHVNILEISASGIIPGTPVTFGSFAKGKNNPEPIPFTYLPADENLIDCIGLELIAGQNFPKNTHLGREKFVILNETGVQRLGFESSSDALGETLTFEDEDHLEIIGVFKNYVQNLYRASDPMAIRYLPRFFRYANIKFRENSYDETMLLIQNVWEKSGSEEFLEYALYSEQLNQTASIFAKEMRLPLFIAVVAIIIAYSGLLGLVIFHTESKVKEIGIRKVLGASQVDVIRFISKGYILLMVIASFLSTPVAWITGQSFLRNFYHRTNMGFDVFLYGFFLILVLGLCIVFSLTFRASGMDPVVSLRDE